MDFFTTKEERRKEKMKDAIKIIIAIVVGLAIGASIYFGLYSYQTSHNQTVYNNGVCSCGGYYELREACRTKDNTEVFYYQCKDCHRTVKTFNWFSILGN